MGKPFFLLTVMLLSFMTNAHTCFRERKKMTQDDFTVAYSHYQALGNQNKNIIIMPPTGGINVLDRSYARLFCEYGFNVFVPESWTGDDEYNLEYGIHNRLYQRTQKSIDLILSTIPQNDFVGILGTSVGGLHSATAIGRNSRLQAGFVITGGVDIAAIIVYSEQLAMREAKMKRMQAFGLKSDKEYVTQLRPHILLDGIHFQGHVGKKLGMVIATEDTVVPAKNQFLLRDLWKPQKTILMQGNHFWSIIKTWLFHRQEIVHFFLEAAHRA